MSASTGAPDVDGSESDSTDADMPVLESITDDDDNNKDTDDDCVLSMPGDAAISSAYTHFDAAGVNIRLALGMPDSAFRDLKGAAARREMMQAMLCDIQRGLDCLLHGRIDTERALTSPPSEVYVFKKRYVGTYMGSASASASAFAASAAKKATSREH